MSLLAPTLEAFFTERLMTQKNASPHTIASYRDCLRLLLAFVHDKTGTPPSGLRVDHLDAPMIAAFLDHLEHDRGIAYPAATPASPRCIHCSASPRYRKLPITRPICSRRLSAVDGS